MKYLDAKGDSIDSAIENALAELGLEKDDVTVEVLQNPRSGFLGFGREPAIVRVSYEPAPTGRAVEFLEGLLQRFGTPAEIQATDDPEERTISLVLSGDNMSAVIGRHGDTLDAIQYLTNIVTNRKEDERWRVTVDAENYRARREESLETLAHRTAQKALKYHKPVALEPMNPHERRTIHATLQDVEGVTTFSVGTEPNRKVVIAPEGMTMPPAQAGGGRKPQSNHRRSSGGRGGRGRRPQGSKPQQQKPAAPRADEE